MKKIILLIALLIFGFSGVYADKVEQTTTSDSLEVTSSWTTVKTLVTARYENMSVLIYNGTTDSIMAYKIDGYVYSGSSRTSPIMDSTRITGVDTDYIEYSPNTFNKVVIKVRGISDSIYYQVDTTIKNSSK